MISINRTSNSKRVGQLKCRLARLKQQWYVYISSNFYGFYPVLLQFMRLNCVQQTSISTRINSSTFSRGSKFVFRYYSQRGGIAMALQQISSKNKLIFIFHCTSPFLPRDAMLSTVYAVALRYGIKTAKCRITQIMPHYSPGL